MNRVTRYSVMVTREQGMWRVLAMFGVKCRVVVVVRVGEVGEWCV